MNERWNPIPTPTSLVMVVEDSGYLLHRVFFVLDFFWFRGFSCQADDQGSSTKGPMLDFGGI